MTNQLSKIRKVIVFKLNDEEYAISIDQVGSIEMMHPITRVPQAYDFIKGVMNLRGTVIPVIDLRKRFGIESIEPTEETRIIVFHLENMEVGLIVDVANDIVDIDEEKIESPPEVVGTVHIDYIEGVVKFNERLLILLDLEKVLTTDEIEHLKSLEG